jgi:hypothetical protein
MSCGLFRRDRIILRLVRAGRPTQDRHRGLVQIKKKFLTVAPVCTSLMFRSVLVIACNRFDKVDDATPEFGLLDAHERLGEREPVMRGEEVEHVGW